MRHPARRPTAVLAGLLLLAGMAPLALAAPAEEALGRAQGYPPAPRIAQAYEERYKVGSFSAMDSLAPHCRMPAAARPLELPRAEGETDFRYRYQGRTLGLEDYMARQRATAVLVVKDGRIVAERYNYARQPDMRMISHSMGKTVVALGIVKALEEGLIRSLEDRAEAYVPALAGSLYGGTRLVNLLRMASGAKYVEDYTPGDDRARVNAAMRRFGTVAGVRVITERAEPEGAGFNYGGAQTAVLGLVLHAATGRGLCDYIGEKVWQAMGAAAAATWLTNPVDGEEYAQGTIGATVHDYARLGWLLANDGAVATGNSAAPVRQVISREHVLDMTDAGRQPEAFRPGRMQNKGSTYYGYGYQVWLLPGTQRRFALLGIHGQIIMVDPGLKLVVVHTAVGKDASGDASGDHLGAERDALLRGIVARYGAW